MTSNGQVTADQPAAKEKPWQELEEDARKAEATDVGVKVTVAGKVYELHFGELTGLDARALRVEVGHTTYGLLNQALGRDGSPDLDTVAAIVWLARRRAGEVALSYDEVAASVKWGDGNSLELADPVPDAPPEIRDAATGEAEHPQA